MKQLKLEVIFGSQDKLSPALKMLSGNSSAAAKALKGVRDEVKRLNDQQKQVDGFIRQKKATEDSAKALKDVQDRIKSLRHEMSTNPSEKLTRDFDKATKEAKKLKDAHSQNQMKLQALRGELQQTGVSTGNLAGHQIELSRKITTANASIDNQKRKLENLNRLQQSHSKISGNARTAAIYGAGMTATGAAALYQLRKPIDESKHVDIEQNRIASLGLGAEATKEATDYAKAMKTFGTSTLDNLALMRDGVTAFADVHHAKFAAPMLAKMKFANEAMYGGEQGGENEKKFMDMLKVIELRNGLKNEGAFKEQANIIQQVITATGGRVQAGEWLNAIKTGGVAVKGLTNEAFYYKMEPIVQELGGHRFGTSAMSAYQNIYQGRTTKRAAQNMDELGLIADQSKVQHDKAGQVSFLNPGALKGAELFKKDQFAWMEQILLPALAAKGITERGQIHDAIGSIFTNRNASNLFTTMYDQREQIHKNAKLNAGADNIDQLNSKAVNTTTGKEIEAKAKLHDAYLTFGQTILPIYTRAIEIATNALKGFNTWMQQNPALAKMLGAGLLVLATSLMAIGGALVVFSPLILSMLSLRLMMATVGAQGSSLGFAFKLLTSPLGLLQKGFIGIGKAFLWVGRLFLTNPILLAVAAIATVAYLIYQNWGALSNFFTNLWAKVTTVTSSAWGSITNTITGWITNISATLSGWGNGLTGWFGGIWEGLKQAFNNGWNNLKSIIRTVDTIFADNPILHFLIPIIGIPRLIIAHWTTISAFFQSLWSGISATVGGWISTIWNTLSNWGVSIRAWSSSIWIGVINAVDSAWLNIETSIGQAINRVLATLQTWGATAQNWLNGLWTSITLTTSTAWISIKTAVSTAWNNLVASIQTNPILQKIITGWQTIFGYLGSLKDKMLGIGQNIIDGLINGIKSGFSGLKSIWTQINSYMPDFMRKKMDIHSPSRVMRGIGRFIVAGLEVGIGQQQGSLQNTYQRIVDTFSVPPSTTSPGAIVPPEQQTIFQKVVALTKPVLEKAPILKFFDQIKSQWNTLWNGLDNIADKFPERMKMLFDVQPEFDQPAWAVPTFNTPVALPPMMNKPLRADTAATVSPAAKSQQLTVEGDTVSIYVTAQPGQSSQDIASEVRRVLETYQREKEHRVRDQFWDNQ
ncbi:MULTISPECIES: phage tail tape measure protein [unclassified Acinetobacter]|uniref:phage tail tape measure protein n=1 Tax=unclassified Acinetobacter TaxID=196816 RepID=UPI00190D59AE|nr:MULTISPECIES: phage tail protein [unclassified Acinetobacter]MBK0062611.1 phage tail protein [Acinetobacter sp. S55]MBK0065812.1 phage tail protein [Acinetobacter sp. S54]